MTNIDSKIRLSGILLLVGMLACSVSALAQKGKKKQADERIPVYNVVLDDPMDVFGREPGPPDMVRIIKLPEFYRKGVERKLDTLQHYECYDAANEIVGPDSMLDYNKIRFISLIQNYTDPLHTYRDDEGKQQPVPTEKIIYRYDKTGKDKWLSVNYRTNKSAFLQEFPDVIVRTDSTLIANPQQGNTIIAIHKYYKVTEAGK